MLAEALMSLAATGGNAVITARLEDLLEQHPEAADELKALVAEVKTGSTGTVQQHAVAYDQAQQAVLGHPETLNARHEIARVMAEQGRHADAETEYRDLLTTKLRVLGPDHPETLKTKSWIDYLERRNQG